MRGLAVSARGDPDAVGPPGTGNDDHKAGIEIVRKALSLAGAPDRH